MNLGDMMAALVRRFKKDAEYRTCVQIEMCKLEHRFVKLYEPYSKSEAGFLGRSKQILGCDKMQTVLDTERQRISRLRALFSQFTDYEIERYYRTAEQRLKDPKSLLRTTLNERAKLAREAAMGRVRVQPKYSVMNYSCAESVDRLPARSVDVIFTDPPYTRAEIDKGVFSDLGRLAGKVLRPTGVMVVYTGYFVERLLDMVRLSDLRVYCQLAITGLKRGKVPRGYALQVQHKVVWVLVPNGIKEYTNYRLNNGLRLIRSCVPSHPESASRSSHHWEQDVETAQEVLSQFVIPEHSLVDPFAGSGAFLKAAQLLGVNDIRGYDLDPVHCTEWVN